MVTPEHRGDSLPQRSESRICYTTATESEDLHPEL